MTKISTVVPLYEEEQNLHELNERLTDVLSTISNDYEIIYVDDGSNDNTFDILQELARVNSQVKYIKFSRNFGHQVAIYVGLYHANGEAVVTLDGDLQDPPELIPSLYKKYQEGFKVVYAKRQRRQGEKLLKKWTASIFYRLMAWITSIDIPVDVGDYRLIDRQVVDKLKLMPERNLFLRGQIAWLGFEQTHVLFDREKRKGGKPGYSFSKLLALALDGITSFSNFPLKLASLFGFVVSFLAFLIILYALYSKFILERVILGWTSLIISTMFIGGIQLIALGIIGEYISRINEDVRKRPLYIVDKSNI